MNTAYDVGVRLSLESAGFSSAVGIAMKLFGDLEGKAGAADKAVAKIAGSMGITTDQLARFSQMTGRYTAQIDAATAANERLGTAMKGVGMIAGGAALTAVGVGLVSFMDRAVQRAMDLQTIMIGIGDRTGVAATDPRLARLETQAASIGLTNQMSTVEVMGVAQAASRAGITNIGQLSHMLKPLANYSEVMLRATGADPSESASTAVKFAHIYGAFGDKTIGGHTVNGKMVGGVSDTAFMVNELGKAMQIVPETQGEFLTMMGNFVQTMRPLYRGKPEQNLISDSINYGVLMSQMGLNTRGGTEMSRFLIQAMGAGSRTGHAALQARQDIERISGVNFVDKTGNINDPTLLFKALTGFATGKVHGRPITAQQTTVEFQQAFKAAGGQIANIFATPGVAERFKTIADAMKSMPNLDVQQRAYNTSTAGRFNQARKSFDSAMTELGVLWLPAATDAANALAGFTAGLVVFARQHHTLMAFAATFVAVSAAVSLVVGPLVALAGIVAIVGGVTGVALLAPVIITIVAIGAAIAAVTLIIMNWGRITHEIGAGLYNLGVMLGLIHNDHPVATKPKGGLPPGGQVMTIQDRHGHYEEASGGRWRWQDTRTLKWHDDGAYTTVTNKHPAPVVHQHPAPSKGAKGGGGGMAPAAAVTIHIHAGAVVNHIAPGHGHDPAKIADEVSKKSADALVKGFRDALAHSGTGPITTLYPTLHRTS